MANPINFTVTQITGQAAVSRHDAGVSNVGLKPLETGDMQAIISAAGSSP
jgi:hypothetical protein